MNRLKVSVLNVATLTGHRDSIYALTGDDNGMIFTASGDGMIVSWDLSRPKDGNLITKIDSSSYALSVIDNKFLVLGDNHQGVRILDLKDNKEVNYFELADVGAIFSVYVLDEDRILALTQNGFLYLLDKKNKKQSQIKLSDKNLRTICKVGLFYYLGDSNGKLFKLTEDFKLVSDYKIAEKPVFGLVAHGNQLLTVSRDCHLRVFKEDVQLVDVVAHHYAINDIAIDPTERLFATASQDKTIKIWDLESKKLLKVIDQARHNGHSNSVNKLFWSRYSNLLVSCSDDREIKIWDIQLA